MENETKETTDTAADNQQKTDEKHWYSNPWIKYPIVVTIAIGVGVAGYFGYQHFKSAPETSAE